MIIPAGMVGWWVVGLEAENGDHPWRHGDRPVTPIPRNSALRYLIISVSDVILDPSTNRTIASDLDVVMILLPRGAVRILFSSSIALALPTATVAFPAHLAPISIVSSVTTKSPPWPKTHRRLQARGAEEAQVDQAQGPVVLGHGQGGDPREPQPEGVAGADCALGHHVCGAEAGANCGQPKSGRRP